jgi:hypothetical protein
MTNTPILKTQMGLTNVWDGVSDMIVINSLDFCFKELFASMK